MKKIIGLLAVIFVVAPLFAQSSGTTSLPEAAEQVKQNYPWVNSQKLNQAMQEALEAGKPTTAKDYPVIKMGISSFAIKFATKNVENGQEVWTYYYEPIIPFIVNEQVALEDGKNNIVYHVRSSQTDPAFWQRYPFKVAGVKIDIYPDNQLEAFSNEWKTAYGEDCIYQKNAKKNLLSGITRKAEPIKWIGLWNLLKKVYLFPNGRTAVINVYASSDKYGPYVRQCQAGNTGLIFDLQPHLEKINLSDFPQRTYGVVKNIAQ